MSNLIEGGVLLAMNNIEQFLLAAELLKFSETTVGEVGKLVGYPNQLHFSRAFKNVLSSSSFIPPRSSRLELR